MWHELVVEMIEDPDLNPRLKGDLVREGGVRALERWARETAGRAAALHKAMAGNGDPMIQAEAREIVIAQLREEIESADLSLQT